MTRRRIVQALAAVILLVGMTGGAVLYFRALDTLKADKERQEFEAVILRDNNALLRIMLAVTGCTTDDTPQECQKRQTDRAAEEGTRRIVEVDCRIRLALAGLPSPPPDRPCTPKENP